jgi:predicted Zn-dependent protease
MMWGDSARSRHCAVGIIHKFAVVVLAACESVSKTLRTHFIVGEHRMRPRLPLVSLVISALVCLGAVSCASVQRYADKVNLYSVEEENAMGLSAYDQVKGSEKPCTDKEAIAMLQRVGKRLAAVVPDSASYAWEFTLLESDEINAFCLPGGKVAFYTGILAYCENEAAIAAVMGHEIGHAVARHGGKRMSQGVILGGAQMALAEVLKSQGVSDSTTNLSLAAAGGLSQVGIILPFSRGHELEADIMGLEYMSKAGYDPEESVRFWQRFAKLGSSGPAFMSTHPQSEDRAKQLGDNMKQAKAWYAAAAKQFGLGAPVPAKYLPKP